MSKVENGAIKEIDETVLINRSMPKQWKCPHCGRKQKTGAYADEILMEHFKYLEHCVSCGYVHIWILKLTDDFKKRVIEYMIAGKRSQHHESNKGET